MTTSTKLRIPLIARAWRGLITTALADVQRYRDIKDYRKLEAMPEYMLRDMGLTPDQVRRARVETERAAFWRLW